MTLVVLLVLAVLWAVVLLPPLLRSRMTSTASVDSIGDFNYKLGVLSRTSTSATPSPMLAPPVVRTTPSPSQRRVASCSRRDRRARRVRRRVVARAAKRRGDVLRVLVDRGRASTMALAYFTGSSLVWGVQLLADVVPRRVPRPVGVGAFGAGRPRREGALPAAQRRAPELALRRTASS